MRYSLSTARRRGAAAIAVTATAGLAFTGFQASSPAGADVTVDDLSAAVTAPGTVTPPKGVLGGSIVDANGKHVGKVMFYPKGGQTLMAVYVRGLKPGFHGLHLHKVGKCEPKSQNPTDPTKVGDFLSAGGHLDSTGAAHPEHDGDLPSLLVKKSGSGLLATSTDRVSRATLADADGTAFVVHAGADNYANIPDRYSANGPDAETKMAGDSGARQACGVIAPARS